MAGADPLALEEALELCAAMLADPGHGWSIGTLGASGEFMRADGEAFRRHDTPGSLAISTGKGALRIRPAPGVRLVAYDMLSADGETWREGAAFCVATGPEAAGLITGLGTDGDAVREEDRGAALFDLGIGAGVVRMAVRTRDTSLIRVLREAEGQALLGEAARSVMPAIFASQPHRVLLSPSGRIEVFQDIPLADGASPEGPHTHVLPNLVARRRLHSANTPIPAGLQSVLGLHPRSAWRDALGRRTGFNAQAHAAFERLLARYALPEDRAVRRSVEQAVERGVAPGAFAWPQTRRGRAQARITLRRLRATRGASAVAAWLAEHDRAPVDADEALPA